MSYKTVLFDLDGTLLNTLADLRSSVNRALLQFGFPERTLDEVRTFVGNGIKKLIDRAVPSGTDEETTAAVLNAFRTDYAAHCADDTAPYEGILPLLRTLKERGIKTAVVSNKADFAVKLLADKYFGDLLSISRGERPEVPKKPAPDMLYAVMADLGADAETTVFIGDSDVDFETARNASLDVILVDWGFRDGDALRALVEAAPSSRNESVVSTTNELLSRLI